uniref:Uncharacterized protein n=1 Tax=Ditylenchus dipsaci TaxID=166011 RepID=A0A915DLV9_9BILA
MNFVDPESGAHTQAVESLWQKYKKRHKNEFGTARRESIIWLFEMANKIETLAQPSLLDGYSTDNVDEFLARALVADKQQKQLIKRLYQDREEIVPNCAPELALQAVVTQSFMSTIEGKKLAGHFLIRTAHPNGTLCHYWGKSYYMPGNAQVVSFSNKILYRFFILDANPLEEDAVNKMSVESSVIQGLFYMVIRANRKYLKMYSRILDGLVSEEAPSKKLCAMMFRCLLPNLWRHLDVPNEDVRISASNLLLRFYPLRCDDDFMNADYLQKQHEAMERMLNDDCLPIRNWKEFPTYTIKKILDKIVDELSLDDAVDVRSAVYEGMVGLLHCVPALNATQHALGLLGNRGINDRAEKVRLAAFRLLNKLKGHRFIKYFDIVEMDEMLRRLDFEHSTAVQSQIVMLVYKSFSPRLVEGIDYIERFKRIRYMSELATMEQAVRHMRSLLIGVKAMLKQNVSSDVDEFDDENDELALDLTGATVLFNEMRDKGKEKVLKNVDKLALAKTILDSAIVLWTSIRFDLFKNFTKENEEVIKSMANILNMLDPYSSNTVMVDSALVIASNLPSKKLADYLRKCWDMDQLIAMISKGLEKLRVFAASEVPCAPDHARDSPPVKRAKALGAEIVNQLRRPIDLIKILLASPNASENLKSHYGVHLNSFVVELLSVRNSFAQSLKSEQWKHVDLKLMMSAYECLTLISLLTKDSEVNEIDIESDDEDTDQFDQFHIRDFLLLKEVKWMEGVLKVRFPPNQVIQMFLRCANLHLGCGELSFTVVSRMVRLLNGFNQRVQKNCGLDSLRDPIKKSALHLSKALEFNEDQVSARQLSEEVIHPILADFQTIEEDVDKL